MKKKILALLLCVGMAMGNTSTVYANGDSEITHSESVVSADGTEQNAISTINNPEDVITADGEASAPEEPIANGAGSVPETGGEIVPEQPQEIVQGEQQEQPQEEEEELIPGEELISVPNSESSEQILQDIPEETVSDDAEQNEEVYSVAIMKSEGGEIRFSDKMTLPEQSDISDAKLLDLRGFTPNTEIMIEVNPEEGFELQELTAMSRTVPDFYYEVQMKGSEYVFVMPEDSVALSAMFRKCTQSIKNKGDYSLLQDERPENSIVLVSGISLDHTKLNMKTGDSVILSASIIPENASNKNLIWTTSDESILKVDSNGEITAVEEGTAVIIAATEDGGYTAQCQITVSNKAIIETGVCGDNLTWSIVKKDENNYSLMISGSGAINDFSYLSDYPWKEYQEIITNVVVENGVTSIGNYAFCKLGNLVNVTIPNTVKSIGSNALSNCSRLKEINIPNSVTSIGEYAFRGCGIVTVTIPAGVTSIGGGAFSYCRQLKEVTITEGVTRLGTSMFYECSNLEKVNLPKSLESISEQAFMFCTKVTDIVIPENVNSIGRQAFYYCNLFNIVIPHSVTSVEAEAFHHYSSSLDKLNVYYTGSQKQWFFISIGDNNRRLKLARIRYEVYTIEYVLNGGVNDSSNLSYYDSASGKNVYLADPTREGYVFLGWYTDAAFTKKMALSPFVTDFCSFLRKQCILFIQNKIIVILFLLHYDINNIIDSWS